jgi:hypothetical protein
MPLTVERDPALRNTLMMQGDTYDLLRVWHRHNLGGGDEGAFEIFGFTVKDIAEGAEHGGLPALRIRLEDSLSLKEVGRLVVQHRRDFEEDRPAWRVIFPNPETASREYDSYAKVKEPHDLVFAELDMSFDPDESPQQLFAEWSAAYGCSFKVLNPHGPAAGNPVIEVSGFRDKVTGWLKAEYCQEGAESPEFYLGESDS